MMKFFLCFTSCILFCFTTTVSQVPEDALRLSYPGVGVGARTFSLGMTSVAASKDFSSMYSNPAGLGQMKLNEVNMGFSYGSYRNSSSFLGTEQSFSNNATNLNSLGLVYAVPTVQGSFVLALGYGRQSDFTTGLSFSGFNPSSSMIPTFYDADTLLDLAYNLKLQRDDGTTPYVDSMDQVGKILEGGGINHWSVSGAIEAARNLYLGLTLSFISGSYNYNRNYHEIDINDKYNAFPYNLDELEYIQTISNDLSGFNARFGMLYRFGRDSRVGLAIKTPSYITVREIFTDEGTSWFDDGDSFFYRLPDGRSEYDVATPFVFSTGIAHGVGNVMLAADVEFTDWTQMEFRNADADLMKKNTRFKEEFQPTLNVHLGGEIALEEARLRAGFAYLPSPFSSDPASFAQKYITGGVGFVIENAIAVDIGYGYGYWETNHQIYQGGGVVPGAATETETIRTHNLISTVAYRF